MPLSEELPEEVSDQLICGKCLCYRRRFSDPGEPLDAKAEQVKERCVREHSLRAWNGLDSKLPYFVAVAVKGAKRPGGPVFQAGAFVQGMYYDALHRHVRLEYGAIAAWRCPEHQGDPAHDDVPIDSYVCKACAEMEPPVSTEFDPKRHKRKKVKGRWVLPTLRGGASDQRDFICCKKQGCGNYFEARSECAQEVANCVKRCPLCQEPVPPYPPTTKLWVNVGICEIVDINENPDACNIGRGSEETESAGDEALQEARNKIPPKLEGLFNKWADCIRAGDNDHEAAKALSLDKATASLFERCLGEALHQALADRFR